MLSLIEYLGLPATVATLIVAVIFVLQLIGELLEAKGKVVPEIIKIRKYFIRKRRERETLSQMTDFMDKYKSMGDTLVEVQSFLKDVKAHYSEDNITKRDGWMQGVNDKFEDLYAKQSERDALVISLNDKIDKNNADTLSLLIDNKRNFILDFATRAADQDRPITREQYKRFFKVHKEYENIIEENNMSNGEVDIAYRMAVESYEERLKNHGFIEDIRGYNA